MYFKKIAEEIDYLLSNPDKAKKMGEKARKMVLENYTWEKNAEKTIKVYEEVLSNAR
jgi:glycosyltransferase involved in cell wall biosynthesis